MQLIPQADYLSAGNWSNEMAISLASLRTNKAKPPCVIVHGDPGIGKSTFGACAPDPVFILTEDGLGSLEVPAFPLAKTFDEVLEAVGSLYQEDHEFKTLVIDSLDWLEPLIWNHVCETWTDKKGVAKRLASIEDAGYGKGYVEAINYWRQFFDGLRALRDDKGMTIIMIAHSAKVKVEDPMLPAYDTYDLKLHKRAAAIAEEYADVILFAQLHTATTMEKKGDKERSRATTNGTRIMHTVGQPAFLAKNRYNLPTPLPLSWASFDEAMKGVCK
jgi:hypothetical protein